MQSAAKSIGRQRDQPSTRKRAVADKFKKSPETYRVLKASLRFEEHAAVLGVREVGHLPPHAWEGCEGSGKEGVGGQAQGMCQ